MQRVVLFISLLLLELHGSSTAANPGFRTAITTKGLDYGQFLRLSPMTDTINVQLKLAGAVRCPELHSALFYCFFASNSVSGGSSNPGEGTVVSDDP